MSWFLAIAGFAALIILHEFGHFAVAKAVGMRVERFSLFFGPMVLKARRGETVYGVGVIPLGGYVKITGMNPQEDVPPEVAPRAYFRQPPWKRIVVILAGPGMNILIAFLLLWVLLWSASKGAADTFGTVQPTNTIAAVDKSFPAFGVLRAGDMVISVDGISGPITRLSRQISTHRCVGAQTSGCAAATPVVITVKRGSQLLMFSIRPRYDPAARRARIGFNFGERVQQLGPLTAARIAVERSRRSPSTRRARWCCSPSSR
jgi:regulator of sigma E protease